MKEIIYKCDYCNSVIKSVGIVLELAVYSIERDTEHICGQECLIKAISTNLNQFPLNNNLRQYTIYSLIV